MNIIKVKSETVVKIIKNEIELGSELRVVGIGDEPMFFKENESLKLIEKYTTKRMNRINELEAYCKLNKLDYTRFYSVVTDTREKQYK